MGRAVVYRTFRVVVMGLGRGADERVERLRGTSSRRTAAAVFFLKFLQLMLQKPHRLGQGGQVHRRNILKQEVRKESSWNKEKKRKEKKKKSHSVL